MRLLYSLLLTLLMASAFGQSKEFTTDSDTAFWYGNFQVILSELGIKPISELEADFAFRFYDGRSIVQIEETDGELTASMNLILRECTDLPREENQLYKSHTKLSIKTASDIHYLVKDFMISSIPSDKFIQGWAQNGLDGITYIIEYMEGEEYAFKSFWSPNSETHRELKESRFLRYFLNELYLIEEINESIGKFMAKQPFTSYFQFLGSSGCVVELGAR